MMTGLLEHRFDGVEPSLHHPAVADAGRRSSRARRRASRSAARRSCSVHRRRTDRLTPQSCADGRRDCVTHPIFCRIRLPRAQPDGTSRDSRRLGGGRGRRVVVRRRVRDAGARRRSPRSSRRGHVHNARQGDDGTQRPGGAPRGAADTYMDDCPESLSPQCMRDASSESHPGPRHLEPSHAAPAFERQLRGPGAFLRRIVVPGSYVQAW
jgi:hypothetical protein